MGVSAGMIGARLSPGGLYLSRLVWCTANKVPAASGGGGGARELAGHLRMTGITTPEGSCRDDDTREAVPVRGGPAAPDVAAGAVRHRRPGPGGLPLGGRPGPRRPDLVAGAAAEPDRLRRLPLLQLLSLRRQLVPDQPR